jgi:hypothetical protein
MLKEEDKEEVRKQLAGRAVRRHERGAGADRRACPLPGVRDPHLPLLPWHGRAGTQDGDRQRVHYSGDGGGYGVPPPRHQLSGAGRASHGDQPDQLRGWEGPRSADGAAHPAGPWQAEPGDTLRDELMFANDCSRFYPASRADVLRCTIYSCLLNRS